MEIVNLKIQLDTLRLEMHHAFLQNKDMREIKKIHFAIKKKEKELLKQLLEPN